jgi:hypothetical protein
LPQRLSRFVLSLPAFLFRTPRVLAVVSGFARRALRLRLVERDDTGRGVSLRSA